MKERQRRQETSEIFLNDLATLLEEARIAVLAAGVEKRAGSSTLKLQ